MFALLLCLRVTHGRSLVVEPLAPRLQLGAPLLELGLARRERHVARREGEGKRAPRRARRGRRLLGRSNELARRAAHHLALVAVRHAPEIGKALKTELKGVEDVTAIKLAVLDGEVQSLRRELGQDVGTPGETTGRTAPTPPSTTSPGR